MYVCTLNCALFDEISLLLLPFVLPQFDLIVLRAGYFQTVLPNRTICAKGVCCQSQSPCFSSLNHLHNYRSSSSSSSKTTALRTFACLNTSHSVLVVFFPLAIIQALSHDCSRANGEYPRRLSGGVLCKGLGFSHGGISPRVRCSVPK